MSLNCTLPVAVDGDIVAVNVIDWPSVDGFCDDERVVVVVAIWFTVCVSTLLVLGTLFVSPRYLATILCDPIDNDDVIMLA